MEGKGTKRKGKGGEEEEGKEGREKERGERRGSRGCPQRQLLDPPLYLATCK